MLCRDEQQQQQQKNGEPLIYAIHIAVNGARDHVVFCVVTHCKIASKCHSVHQTELIFDKNETSIIKQYSRFNKIKMYSNAGVVAINSERASE